MGIYSQEIEVEFGIEKCDHNEKRKKEIIEVN